MLDDGQLKDLLELRSNPASEEYWCSAMVMFLRLWNCAHSICDNIDASHHLALLRIKTKSFQCTGTHACC